MTHKSEENSIFELLDVLFQGMTDEETSLMEA
jgi:hypothetical protein